MSTIEKKLEGLILQSCLDGEVGDIRSILDEEFNPPTLSQFQEIVKFVRRELTPHNDFGAHPNSLAYDDDDGWFFDCDDDDGYTLTQICPSHYAVLSEGNRHKTKLANGKWAYFKYEY